MTAFFHVWHWLRSDPGILAATLATILGAVFLRTLARTTPGVRPGAPRDRINDLNGVNAWRERDERILRGELHAAADLIHGGDTGHCPRCLIGRNDNYLPIIIPCPEHKPAGRHHYTAPVHGPEPVVAEPDFDEWVDEWNRRYAE